MEEEIVLLPPSSRDRDRDQAQNGDDDYEAFEAEVSAHSNAIVSLDNTGQEMIQQGHYASEVIRKRLEELRRLWGLLLSRLAEKGLKLQQALVLVQFLRSCDEVLLWISDKEAFVTADEFGTDLEHVEVLQRKLDEFQKDMASHGYTVSDVNIQSDKLINDGHPERDTIVRKREDLNEAWQRLKQLAVMRQEKLFGAHEIQRFRDADETIAWISEKDVILSSDEYGRELASIQALQRKHEGVDRDFAALQDKVNTLETEGGRLCEIHGDHSLQIRQQYEEIVQTWEMLVDKAKSRKAKLDDSYALHRFVSEYRDLINWINDMNCIISAAELAKDVAGVEALLQRHQQHKGEIDAREDSFKLITDSGNLLLENEHFAGPEVGEKLSNLRDVKSILLKLWKDRRILYEQCMDLQVFYRDTEQADTWLVKQEAFLETQELGDSLDSVEAVIKKHEDFEKSLAAPEEKIKALDEFASKWIEGQHYAAENVSQRRALLLQRRNALVEKSAMRRATLEAAFKPMQFERDCDETKRKADSLEQRYAALMGPMKQLFRDIEDEEAWIREKEPVVGSNDRGRDLITVQHLITKHQAVLSEISNHEPRVNAVCENATAVSGNGQFLSDEVFFRVEKLKEQWIALKDNSEKRKQDLEDALMDWSTQTFDTVESIDLLIRRVQLGALTQFWRKNKEGKLIFHMLPPASVKALPLRLRQQYLREYEIAKKKVACNATNPICPKAYKARLQTENQVIHVCLFCERSIGNKREEVYLHYRYDCTALFASPRPGASTRDELDDSGLEIFQIVYYMNWVKQRPFPFFSDNIIVAPLEFLVLWTNVPNHNLRITDQTDYKNKKEHRTWAINMQTALQRPGCQINDVIFLATFYKKRQIDAVDAQGNLFTLPSSTHLSGSDSTEHAAVVIVKRVGPGARFEAYFYDSQDHSNLYSNIIQRNCVVSKLAKIFGVPVKIKMNIQPVYINEAYKGCGMSACHFMTSYLKYGKVIYPTSTAEIRGIKHRVQTVFTDEFGHYF